MGFILGMQEWFNIHKEMNIIHHTNNSNEKKDKTHMEISIDREKTFDKTWHPFMIETLDKLGVEGIFLILI